MTDREKLIDLLLIPSKTLEYEDAERIAKYLLAHGVTVREPNRPLKLHEVIKHFRQEDPSVLWLEDKRESYNDGWDKNDAVYYRLNVSAYRRDMADTYGKTWRCWAEKPTEEERKAAPWE